MSGTRVILGKFTEGLEKMSSVFLDKLSKGEETRGVEKILTAG